MDTLLTTDEAAARLRVHSNTVIRWIKDGKLQAARLGSGYRIKESEIAHFLGDAKPAIAEAHVIAVANQKGGVAKTTTVTNLAVALARGTGSSARVLLVDLDPQGGCGVQLGVDTSGLQRTVYNVLVEPDVPFSKVIVHTRHGVDLAPSNIDLAGAEIELKHILSQESVLKRRLQAVASEYDYILIDTPPSLGILTVNALTAAEAVLIPVATEYMALRGLEMLFKTIESVRSVVNPGLRIAGLLATKYDNRTLNSKEIYDYLAALAAKQGIRLYTEAVRASVRVTESPASGMPIVLSHPELEAARAYQQIALELAHEYAKAS